MLSSVSQISPVAVLAATVASFVLGGIWFVALFAKQYIIVLGRQALPPQKPSPLFIVGPLVCSLISIVTSALLLKALHIESMSQALTFGAVVGVGYIASTCLNIAINPNFPHPFKYTLINAPYFILSSLMSSAILYAIG